MDDIIGLVDEEDSTLVITESSIHRISKYGIEAVEFIEEDMQ